MTRTQHYGTEPAEDYLHETACGLEDGGSVIDRTFVEVMKEAAETAPVECVMAAAGCGSCFHTEGPAAIFWVAQSDAIDKVAVKFDSEDNKFTREELGHHIVETAHEHNVDVSWNGDTSSCVFLGVEGYYENLEPGTVIRDKYDRRGIVIEPELIYNPDTPYKVYDQEDYDGIGDGGEIVARFSNREEANDYVSRQDKDDEHFKVSKQIIRGRRDGDVMFITESDGTPVQSKRTNLTVIDQ